MSWILLFHILYFIYGETVAHRGDTSCQRKMSRKLQILVRAHFLWCLCLFFYSTHFSLIILKYKKLMVCTVLVCLWICVNRNKSSYSLVRNSVMNVKDQKFSKVLGNEDTCRGEAGTKNYLLFVSNVVSQ